MIEGNLKIAITVFNVLQAYQTVGFLFMNFTRTWEFKGHPYRNYILPKVLYVTVFAVFVVVPLGKVLIYLWFVYRTDLLTTIAGSWLLVGTVNSLYILLAWYGARIEPLVEEGMQQVKDEAIWEKERHQKSHQIAKTHATQLFVSN